MAIEIKLSQKGKYAGQFVAFVDEADSELAKLNWSVAKNKLSKVIYAYRMVKGKSIFLHQAVLETKLGNKLEKGQLVDHVDGDGLNCQRNNLRLATHSQNLANRGKTSQNSTGLKGVYWHNKARKFTSFIQFNKKQYYLGLFETKEAAHEAYKNKAQELHKEFANFGN